MKNILLMIMIITSIAIIAQMQIDRHKQEQEKINKQICIQELIPIDEFEVIGD